MGHDVLLTCMGVSLIIITLIVGGSIISCTFENIKRKRTVALFEIMTEFKIDENRVRYILRETYRNWKEEFEKNKDDPDVLLKSIEYAHKLCQKEVE